MTEPESKQPEAVEKIEQETGVAYDIEEGTVSYTAAKNDTQHFVDFIKYLFTKGHVTADDLPYTPGHGKIRYLLNNSPVHQDGRNMTRPEQIADDIYLETNHDSESKLRYTKQMIEDFVLE